MSGYQTIEAIRAIPPSTKTLTAVVPMDLVRPNGVPRRMVRKPGNQLSKEAVAYLRRRRAEGATLHTIARELNCCHGTVCRLTRDITPPDGGWGKGGAPRKLNRAFAHRLRRAGFTYEEIAENLGCRRTVAHKLINGERDKPLGKVARISPAVQLVSRLTGIACRDLRKPLRGPERTQSYHVTKARSILVWVAKQKWPRLSVAMICRSLGGLDVTAARAGLRTANNLIAQNEIAVGEYPGSVARVLWALDWPTFSNAGPR